MKPDERQDELEAREDMPAFEEDKQDNDEELREGEVTIPAKGEEKEEEEAVEETPKYSFKTDEELDEFLKSRQVEEKPTTPAPVPPTKEEAEKDEFDDLTLFKGYKDPKTGEWVGETPEDWNDFARRVLRQVSPKVIAPKILEEVREMTAKERAELTEIDKGFDKEYDTLASQNLVPQRNTKEGEEINKQITNIGATYGQSSITKSYELWKKIPKEHGGGLEYVSPAKQKVNASKQVAGKIGSSSGGGKPKAGSISYEKLHSARGVDELLEDEDL